MEGLLWRRMGIVENTVVKVEDFMKHVFINGGKTLVHAVRYYAQISSLPKSKSYRSSK
jgi:hypothetical protein